jgi:hypothetical protein
MVTSGTPPRKAAAGDNQSHLDNPGASGDTAAMGVKRNPVGGLVRYARSFYELLGNRRKFERVPFSGTIVITCKGAVVDSTYLASCVDISPRGMAVECLEPLTVDGFVQLQSEDHSPRRMARVRYCIPRGDRYRAGLEFIAEP